MRVYIAGPMRGIENDNHDEFDAAEKYLAARGVTPVSPAHVARALGKGLNGKYETDGEFIRQVMVIDTTIICRCDGIMLLPGWEKSKGCLMEIALANSIDIPIYLFSKECTKFRSQNVGFSPYRWDSNHQPHLQLGSLSETSKD